MKSFFTHKILGTELTVASCSKIKRKIVKRRVLICEAWVHNRRYSVGSTCVIDTLNGTYAWTHLYSTRWYL
mgnify:CR=1 FL=1